MTKKYDTELELIPRQFFNLIGIPKKILPGFNLPKTDLVQDLDPILNRAVESGIPNPHPSPFPQVRMAIDS